MRFKVEVSRLLTHSMPPDALGEIAPALGRMAVDRDVYVFYVEADSPPPDDPTARWRTTWSPHRQLLGAHMVMSMEIEPRYVSAITEITYRSLDA